MQLPRISLIEPARLLQGKASYEDFCFLWQQASGARGVRIMTIAEWTFELTEGNEFVRLDGYSPRSAWLPCSDLPFIPYLGAGKVVFDIAEMDFPVSYDAPVRVTFHVAESIIRVGFATSTTVMLWQADSGNHLQLGADSDYQLTEVRLVMQV